MKRAKTDLGDLEAHIMKLVWAHGPATAEKIREHMDRDLKESTVRTVLRRLEQKGYVRHTTENRTFIYCATEKRQHLAAKAVKSIADWFCNGSVDEVLVGMVDADMLDKAQIDKLAERIAEVRHRTKTKTMAKGK